MSFGRGGYADGRDSYFLSLSLTLQWLSVLFGRPERALYESTATTRQEEYRDAFQRVSDLALRLLEELNERPTFPNITGEESRAPVCRTASRARDSAQRLSTICKR